MIRLLAALFVLAQLADALTINMAREVNPVVLTLGLPLAYLCKAAVVVFVLLAARRDHLTGTFLLAFGAILGLVGWASNQ